MIFTSVLILLLSSNLTFAQQGEVEFKDIFFRTEPSPKKVEIEDLKKPLPPKVSIKLYKKLYESQSELEIIQDTEALQMGGVKMSGGLAGAYAFGKIHEYTPSHRTIHLLDSSVISRRKKAKFLRFMGTTRKLAIFPQLASKYFIIDGYIQTSVALKGRRATEHPAVSFTLKTAGECQDLFESSERGHSGTSVFDTNSNYFQFMTGNQNLEDQLEWILGECKTDQSLGDQQVNQANRTHLIELPMFQDKKEIYDSSKVFSK